MESVFLFHESSDRKMSPSWKTQEASNMGRPVMRFKKLIGHLVLCRIQHGSESGHRIRVFPGPLQ